MQNISTNWWKTRAEHDPLCEARYSWEGHSCELIWSKDVVVGGLVRCCGVSQEIWVGFGGAWSDEPGIVRAQIGTPGSRVKSLVMKDNLSICLLVSDQQLEVKKNPKLVTRSKLQCHNQSKGIRACSHGDILSLQFFHPSLILALAIGARLSTCPTVSALSSWAMWGCHYVQVKIDKYDVLNWLDHNYHLRSGPSNAGSSGARTVCPWPHDLGREAMGAQFWCHRTRAQTHLVRQVSQVATSRGRRGRGLEHCPCGRGSEARFTGDGIGGRPFCWWL